MQHAGSGTRVQPSTFGSGSGSHGFIKAPSGLNGKSRKNGSCNAIVQRNPKSSVQIHGALDHEPQTKIPSSSRNTSELRLTTQGTGGENLKADECLENRAYKVNIIPTGIPTDGIVSGNVSNRSGVKCQIPTDR